MLHTTPNKLNEVQLNLIRSFTYLRNEQEIKEIESLINFYLEQKLDAAITKAETNNNYSHVVYEEWLNTQNEK